MTICKRNELKQEIGKGRDFSDISCVLLFGERFLCQQTADELVSHLLATGSGTVHPIDGDEEDPQQTLSRLLSFSLLPGLQIYRVTDSRLFSSGKEKAGQQIWAKVEKALQAGNQGSCMRLLRSLLEMAGLDQNSPPSLAQMSKGDWREHFGFDKPAGDLSWTVPLLAGGGKKTQGSAGDVASQYVDTLKKGLPKNNILILTAESVDKRKALFTYLKKEQLVVDCSIDTGGSSAAQTAQKEVIRELMANTLREFGKTIDPQAVNLFLERVGFHPVAVVTEMEKLCHFTGEERNITVEDLEEMVANSREGALFELTDAFAKRQTGRTLTILNRLQDQGVHGLAILATMRNFLRRMLTIRCIQMLPEHRWPQGISANNFQRGYLKNLKEAGRWGEITKGHPYALYMNFTRAAGYSATGLKRWMEMVLKAEYRLKGSPVPQRLVLEELFLSMLRGAPRKPNDPKHSLY